MSHSLLEDLSVDAATRAMLAADFDRFAEGLPDRLEDYIRERYRLDLASEYGGIPVKNPFGKGSGQLSLNISQVGRDAREGLGFVVLKTIIAEDDGGGQSMSEWAIPETRMAVERIEGTDGTPGWTVTWKGRGWYDTLENYMEFFGASLDHGDPAGMLVVPSCKYHLPRPGEREWREGEYDHTTGRLLDIWTSRRRGEAMPIEKDFSPTLAGSDRAAQSELILEWLRRVPGLVRRAAGSREVTVGLKLFNAVFDDDFQIEMLRAVAESVGSEDAPDFLVYANRLFDANREFESVRGVAFGGPDLSSRNLRVLARYRALERSGEVPRLGIAMSATGDIASGRVAAEYLLRGASTFQMHTLFQLPAAEYAMRSGSKTARALHSLLFHPDDGFVASVLHLRRKLGWPEEWNVGRMAREAGSCEADAPDSPKPSRSAISVRPLGDGNLTDAIRLSTIAGWNQTDADWRRLLQLEPDGCYAALDGERLVATTTTTRYGRDLAWIGMVLVDPDHRRRGIATRLVRQGLDHLDGCEVATVKLDATPAGQPVYEALGFEVESRIERWERGAPAVERTIAGGPTVEIASDSALAELLALDRLAFGADRSALLRALASDANQTPLVVFGDGSLDGYAFTRRGARASYLGPIVAKTSAIGAALVDAALARLEAGSVYVDVDTRFDGVEQMLVERGFTKQRDLVRMRRGAALGADAPELVLAIAGPEVG